MVLDGSMALNLQGSYAQYSFLGVCLSDIQLKLFMDMKIAYQVL